MTIRNRNTILAVVVLAVLAASGMFFVLHREAPGSHATSPVDTTATARPSTNSMTDSTQVAPAVMDSAKQPLCRDLPGYAKPSIRDTSWRKALTDAWDSEDTAISMGFILKRGRALVFFDSEVAGCWLEKNDAVAAHGVDDQSEPKFDPYIDAQEPSPGSSEDLAPVMRPMSHEHDRYGFDLKVTVAGRKGIVFSAGFEPLDNLARIPGQELLEAFPGRFWGCDQGKRGCVISIGGNFGASVRDLYPYPALTRMEHGKESLLGGALPRTLLAHPLLAGGSSQDMSLREAILQVAPWNKGGLQVTLAARNGDSLAAPRTECWEKLGNGSWRFADCDQGKPMPASDDIHWVPLDQAAKFRIVELDDNPESGAKRCVNRCD